MTVRSLGYETDEAVSGQTALDKLKVRTFAAVLLDIQMPEMSGLECSEKIRAFEIGLDCRIPIIAFTCQSESNLEQRCLDAGVDTLLDKACSSERLGLVLKQFVVDLRHQ